MLVFYGSGAFVGLGRTGSVWEVSSGAFGGPGLTESSWLPMAILFEFHRHCILCEMRRLALK